MHCSIDETPIVNYLKNAVVVWKTCNEINSCSKYAIFGKPFGDSVARSKKYCISINRDRIDRLNSVIGISNIGAELVYRPVRNVIFIESATVTAKIYVPIRV